MKEYRIRAYFKEVYSDRSYKGKVFTNLLEAEQMFQEAINYYNSVPYSDKLIKVQIESREVQEWAEDPEYKKSQEHIKQLLSEKRQ